MLTFRKRGANLVMATVFLVLPVLVGVSVAFGGSAQPDSGQRDFGIVFAVVLGAFAAAFLTWQFRPGKLEAADLGLRLN